jgi:hypothetical protein
MDATDNKPVPVDENTGKEREDADGTEIPIGEESADTNGDSPALIMSSDAAHSEDAFAALTGEIPQRQPDLLDFSSLSPEVEPEGNEVTILNGKENAERRSFEASELSSDDEEEPATEEDFDFDNLVHVVSSSEPVSSPAQEQGKQLLDEGGANQKQSEEADLFGDVDVASPVTEQDIGDSRPVPEEDEDASGVRGEKVIAEAPQETQGVDEHESDDLKDFGEFDVAPPSEPVEISELSPVIVATAPPTVPESSDDGVEDDFGDFGDFNDAGINLVSSPVKAQEEDFGDFGDFNEGNDSESIAAVPTVAYSDPFVGRAKLVLAQIFDITELEVARDDIPLMDSPSIKIADILVSSCLLFCAFDGVVLLFSLFQSELTSDIGEQKAQATDQASESLLALFAKSTLIHPTPPQLIFKRGAQHPYAHYTDLPRTETVGALEDNEVGKHAPRPLFEVSETGQALPSTTNIDIEETAEFSLEETNPITMLASEAPEDAHASDVKLDFSDFKAPT